MPIHVSTVLFLTLEPKATCCALSWQITIQCTDCRFIAQLEKVSIELKSHRVLHIEPQGYFQANIAFFERKNGEAIQTSTCTGVCFVNEINPCAMRELNKPENALPDGWPGTPELAF
jgi:hypothetical protein